MNILGFILKQSTVIEAIKEIYKYDFKRRFAFKGISHTSVTKIWLKKVDNQSIPYKINLYATFEVPTQFFHQKL